MRGRRASIVVVVIALAAVWSTAAFGKTAPFSYWTASDASQRLVQANLQIGVQLAHHSTLKSAACKGGGASLIRQHRRVYRAFDCTARFHDDVTDVEGDLTVSFVTSKSRRGQISCWARNHAGLVAKHCL